MDQQVIAGLKKIPTYNEVVRFIETDPVKIGYPNRVAELRRWDFRTTKYDNWMEQKTQDEVIRQAQFRQNESNHQPYTRPDQRPYEGSPPEEPWEYIDRSNGQPPLPPPPPPPGPMDRANDVLDRLTAALPPSAPYHPAPQDGMANALRAAGLPPTVVNPPENIPQPLDAVDRWEAIPDAEMTQEDRDGGYNLRRRAGFEERQDMQSGGGGDPPAPPGGGAIAERRGRGTARRGRGEPTNMQSGGGGYPPAPPGAGAIVRRTRRRESDETEDVAAGGSDQGPPPGGDVEMAEQPQHFLDLSHVGQQMQAHAALTAGALIQGFQNQLIPAIQQQGRNLADHVVNMAGQRVQQALQAEGWLGAAEAVAMEGVEAAGAGAAIAALAPEAAVAGAGALAVAGTGLVVGSVVQHVTHNWHMQNNQNTHVINNIQQQAQHDAGNGRRPLRSVRELNMPYPPNHTPTAVFQPPRPRSSSAATTIPYVDTPADPSRSRSGFRTEPRKRPPTPDVQIGGSSGSNDQPPPPPPAASIPVPKSRSPPARPETISTTPSTGEAMVKKPPLPLKSRTLPVLEYSEFKRRMARQKDKQTAREFDEKTKRLRKEKRVRDDSEVRGMSIPRASSNVGVRGSSRGADIPTRGTSVPTVTRRPRAKARAQPDGLGTVPERGRPKAKPAKAPAKPPPDRSRSKSKGKKDE